MGDQAGGKGVVIGKKVVTRGGRAAAEPGNVPSVHHARHDRGYRGRVCRDDQQPARSAVTTPWPAHRGFAGPAATAGPRLVPALTPTDSELLARIEIMSDQVMTAQAESVLGRAAYNRACDDEAAAYPWPRDPMDQLAVPRVAQALAARLAAVKRFGIWARELDQLQREARARGLLMFTD
jgi:hypothetical protein